MISIQSKVLGLAVVVAALGTGCAVDAADADLEQAGLDEVEALDSTAAALEESAEEERGGYQAQAPSKDLYGPSKGGPSKKGMLGPQGPVGQLGQGPVGQLGKAPIGQVGQAPIGQLSQVGSAQAGLQDLVGGAQGQSGRDGARNFGCFPGLGFGGGLGGLGFGGLGGFGGGFGGFPIVSNNNNNNIAIAQILDEMFRFMDDRRNDHHHHHCHGHQ
ncbi:hypothetical protein WME76_14600 [Sorangium sp. So ce119]|uniref:hypothetical protein n=1 Tax=Sorangium sp. So ce119 TaxID=3133279 RepID=UPI003F5DC6E4